MMKKAWFVIPAIGLLSVGTAAGVFVLETGEPGKIAKGAALLSTTSIIETVVAKAQSMGQSVLAPPGNVGPQDTSTSVAAGGVDLMHGHQAAPWALRNNPNAQPVALLSSTGKHGSLSSAQINTIYSETAADLGTVYTSTMAHNYETTRVVPSTMANASGQTVVGGGGETIIRIISVTVTGSSATETAVVTAWVERGHIVVEGTQGSVKWVTPRAEEYIRDTLTKSSDGSWLVAHSLWRFVPGFGPGGGTRPTKTFPTVFST